VESFNFNPLKVNPAPAVPDSFKKLRLSKVVFSFHHDRLHNSKRRPVLKSRIAAPGDKICIPDSPLHPFPFRDISSSLYG
jgi:hypothetical protein